MKGNKKTQGWNAVAKGLVWAMLLEMILSALLAALMAKGVVAESAMISVVAIMSGMASFLGSALAKRGRGAAEAMMTAVSFGFRCSSSYRSFIIASAILAGAK